MSWRWLKLLVAVMQTICVLGAQFALPILQPRMVAAPHPPLHKCGQHQCGCDHDAVSSRRCCCFQGSEEHAKEPTLFERVIRAGQCSGDPDSHSVVVAKLWCVFEPGLRVEFVVVRGETDAGAILSPATRADRPPVPPPKLLLSCRV